MHQQPGVQITSSTIPRWQHCTLFDPFSARALEYTRATTPTYGFQRALYDGIYMLFPALLDRPSVIVMEGMIASVLLKESGATGAKALNSLLKVVAPVVIMFSLNSIGLRKGHSSYSVV
jgi:midasin (ATPase involved in ribosome maturation)